MVSWIKSFFGKPVGGTYNYSLKYRFAVHKNAKFFFSAFNFIIQRDIFYYRVLFAGQCSYLQM